MMMNHRTRLAALVLAGFALTGAAQAQSSQAKKDLIARVIQLQQPSIEQIGQNIAGQTAQQVLQVAGQAVSQLPADKQEAVGKSVQADIKQFYDELAPLLRDRATKLAPTAMGSLLDEKMSEDELKQLVAWLESPAAKKFNEVGPQMLNSLQEKLVADTKPTVEPKLRALEDSLRKKLGINGSAAPAPAASGAAKPAAKAPVKK
ncbi:DUF2059 domain-containing protein [Ideonella sp.]|uniref:DUF2059 domain-containing protein n=2 Tax=Ideonella sp. TaxID=1929293 RepID=UPI00351B4AEB